MEKSLALIGIIIENKNNVSKVNNLLSEYGEFIIGRMGLPYQKRNLNLISIFIDASLDDVNSLSGKLGNLDGVKVKVLFTR